jgi:hypothetical protein
MGRRFAILAVGEGKSSVHARARWASVSSLARNKVRARRRCCVHGCISPGFHLRSVRLEVDGRTRVWERQARMLCERHRQILCMAGRKRWRYA